MLDLFFTNNESLVIRVETMPGISDHNAVFIENNLQTKRTPVVNLERKLYKRSTLIKLKKNLKILGPILKTIIVIL